MKKVALLLLNDSSSIIALCVQEWNGNSPDNFEPKESRYGS